MAKGSARHAIQIAKAGAIRQTVSQVFNKDGIQRLGNLWEYTMKKLL